jgi:cytochrome c-type protein NapB
LVAAIFAVAVSAAELSGIRGATPLDRQAKAAPMAKELNTDLRRGRGFPEQPPTIPHAITGYQIDLNANKCLACHSRRQTETSQAPMISVTHFMDRDGQVLASISPRRYFCTQCHVPQTDARPPVDNGFVDVDTLLDKRPPAARK